MAIEARDVLFVRRKVEEVMKGVPSSHGFAEDGFGHVQVGTEYALFLAKKERFDPDLARVTFLLHDIRFWDEEERKARKRV